MTHSPRLHSWLTLAVSLALVIPAVASAQGIEQPRVPLRTALDEIRTLREAYAKAFNEKDAATLAGMYAPDAMVIRADGVVMTGNEAIRKDLEAGQWPAMSITSDNVRVYGNTALDVGTVSMTPTGGQANVSHYLVVLRRGIKDWKVTRVAVVPEGRPMGAMDSTAH